MMKRTALLVLFFVLAAPVAYAEDSGLLPFELKDQFNQKYTEKNFLGKVSVWIGSDRDGSVYNPMWGEALNQSVQDLELAEAVHFVGVADLRGVPFFLKGFVRGKFPQKKERWVLMDWQGVFSKKYSFQAGVSNILVFSSTGDLVYRTTGEEPDKVKVDSIAGYIKGALD
jgi:hypothetical protein